MALSELVLLGAMCLFLVATYVAAGWLVLRRVREWWDRPHRLLGAVVLVIWPAVVLGIEVGWLLGLNSWHFRPDR